MSVATIGIAFIVALGVLLIGIPVAVVDARPDPMGTNELVAWVVPGEGLGIAEIRRAAERVVKGPMQPGRIVLLEALPRRLRPWLERAIVTAIGFVGAFLAWSGWHYTVAAVGTTSAAIAYPMPLLYASAIVCGGLVTLFALERLLLAAPASGAPA